MSRPSIPAHEKQPPTNTISPARIAAFRVLEQVAATSAHSDDLLHGPLLNGLSTADAALTTALVMGVLRLQLMLESELLPLLARPDDPLPIAVATTLRLGAFQLLHMDRIPPHAALNESVELIKAFGPPRAAGMVNAVLRKLATQKHTTATPRKPIAESTSAMAARLGHPQWMVERWIKTYGRKATEALCAYDLHEPAAPALFLDSTPQTHDPANDQEQTSAIDDGSRLIAELAAAIAPHSTHRVWDACAAPGGKTSILAERLPAAHLLATDISPKRLRRLTERLQRTLGPDRVQTQLADAAALPTNEGPFDLILCDAPCSGTGTLARNPEIKLRLEPADLTRQSERQIAILRGAIQHLAPGGRLVYSTCSLEPEENQRIAEQVLHETGLRLIPAAAALETLLRTARLHTTPAESKQWLSGEFLRTLPGANFNGDGFFSAIFERPL